MLQAAAKLRFLNYLFLKLLLLPDKVIPAIKLFPDFLELSNTDIAHFLMELWAVLGKIFVFCFCEGCSC